MDATAELRRAHRTAAIVSASFVLSILAYGVLAHALAWLGAPLGGFVGPAEARPLRLAFWAVTGASAVALPLVRRQLLTKAPGEDARASLGRLGRAALVTNAMAEVPALLGLVLVMLNRLYLDFYVLGALSLLLILVHFPRYAAWEDWLREPAPRP